MAFDSCAPTRERWSAETVTELEEQRAAAVEKGEREYQAKKAQEVMCASDARVEEICNPAKDPSFLCKIFTCEEEASSP